MRRTHRAIHLLFLVPLVCSATECTRAQPATEPAFTLKAVGLNAWAAIDNRKAQSPSGSNAGFVIGEDSVAVIDTFASVEAARQLLAEIRRLTKLPVKFVINTHHHPDHVSGNGVFANAGAVVLAQRHVRDWIHSENLRSLAIAAAAGHDISPGQKALTASFAAPTAVYDDGVDLYLGSRAIQVRSFPGHTGGDSIVLVPDARLAFAGDLFWRNTLPNTIDASTGPWIDTLNALMRNEAGFTFVPGHGDVGSDQDVAAFRDYLATLRKLVADAQAQGRSDAVVVDAVMTPLKNQYGWWDFFEYSARPNILEMDAELRGRKRIPGAAAK
jgi:glyoxylase-like metal-dependent hydrolase (beta-lactamase superfamily II)